LKSALRNLELEFQFPVRNEFWISFFCKSLYGFLILKLLMSWYVLADIATYSPYQFTSWYAYILYAPLLLLQINIKAYLICFLGLLIISVLIQTNYISAILIFWFSVSLSRFMFSILNGSDIVLNLFLIIAVFLPAQPHLKSSGIITQKIISSVALLFARITLCLVYFLSGYDKLVSSAWRSGAAVHSVINLDYFYNPAFVFHGSNTLFMLIGWSVIIFEISFSLLIWFKKFRMLFLLAGILFHLGIIVLLGLPDFGLVMIICYTVFLPIKNELK
jgi:hypothetical protein